MLSSPCGFIGTYSFQEGNRAMLLFTHPNNQTKLMGLFCIVASVVMTICPPELVQNI